MTRKLGTCGGAGHTGYHTSLNPSVYSVQELFAISLKNVAPSVRILPTMVPVRVASVDNSNHLAPSECVRTMLLVDPVQSSSPSVTLSCTTPFLRIHVRSTGVLLYGRRRQALELGGASRADAASRAGRREGYLCACSPHEKQTFVLDV